VKDIARMKYFCNEPDSIESGIPPILEQIEGHISYINSHLIAFGDVHKIEVYNKQVDLHFSHLS